MRKVIDAFANLDGTEGRVEDSGMECGSGGFSGRSNVVVERTGYESLEDVQANVKELVGQAKKKYIGAGAADQQPLSAMTPKYDNFPLWLEQFLLSDVPVSAHTHFQKLVKQEELEGFDHVQARGVLQQQAALSSYALESTLFPSYAKMHALVAYYMYRKCLAVDASSAITLPDRDQESVFYWDSSWIYSGKGAEIYSGLVRGAQGGEYGAIYRATNQLFTSLLLDVQKTFVHQSAEKSFTRGLMLIGPSDYELGEVLDMHLKVNSKDISGQEKAVGLYVLTQSLQEIIRLSSWTGVSSPLLDVVIQGADVRDFVGVSRQDNFGMDTIMKGLTSGNFSEAEIVELAKKCTRPHDQFYIDFQEPSEDMSSVIKAYEDESIVRLVSYNFKHWLQRMGVADKYLQNFESHVKVLAADYVDPELAYAKPVVHCVDLDAVDPDILKIMEGVGCSMPKHTVLCRSTRRDKEGFLEYLKGQGISARRSIKADPRDGSGMIHGCVFGAESE